MTILSPVTGSTFAGGTSLSVALAGNDEEDGMLPGSSLSWWVLLHHDTHTHPFQPVTMGASGVVSVPSVEHTETDVFLRFYARAIDSGGSADTTFVDVDPRLVTLTFETVPSGLEILVDGQPRPTPFQLEATAGVQRTLWARSPQSFGAFAWTFDGWAHGGAAEQTYVPPEGGATLTATFSESGPANVPPSVEVTSPGAGATLTTGLPVTLTADASDPDGTVVSVQFVVGGTVLGSDPTAPYSIEWTPAGSGTRTLRARATDDFGETSTSDPVVVNVQASGTGDVLAPTTVLTSPTHGTAGLTGSVTATATATDDVGVVAVEFQVDGETIGTDTSAPYAATLPSTGAYASGAHTFRARARDAAGNWSEWSSAAVLFGGGVPLPAGFSRTTYASGFNAGPFEPLTAAAFAPDGRLFVLELQGAIRVVSGGTLLPTPFATLPVFVNGESGLLGITLDPAFSTNGYVYVYYTTDEGGSVRNRISRLTASGNVAAAGSEVVLVELENLSGYFHVGGALAFGPDGKLYAATGDNGVPTLSPSLTSRFGKILRYNPDGTIPADNPFAGSTSGAYRAIWARGLRNPFTFAFRPGTGRMHINDVGSGMWEEINQGLAGANYGWPETEGPTENPAYVGPILAYRHHSSPETLFTGFSIVGAAFYDPPTNLFGAAYSGDYFFADYVAGWVYRMDSDRWDTAYAFANIEQGVTNLLVGPDGALYVLVNGRVDRIGR